MLSSDVVMKMTALAGLLIPLNLITGLFGMNVRVPGQGVDSLEWFTGICVGLGILALVTFWAIRKTFV